VTVRLYVLGGREVGSSFEVVDGLRLGRGPDNDVRLSERSISRDHARVERRGDAWVLCDLESRNGIRVDGARVHEVRVFDGLELLLGDLPLRFREEPAPASAPPAATATPAPAPGRASGPPATPRRLGPEDGGGIELEEEIELGAPAAPSVGAPVTASGASAEPGGRDARRARVLAQGRGSLLGSDLAQRPVWVRFAVLVLLLVLFAAVVGGTFLLVRSMRSAL